MQGILMAAKYMKNSKGCEDILVIVNKEVQKRIQRNEFSE
jgi:hypothetical protein